MIKQMTLIYIMKDNQTLFLKRALKTPDEISVDKFIGVGGKVDSTDLSIYDAAIREMFEETNLVPHSLIKKGTATFIGQKDYDIETTVYICTDFSGELKEDQREGTLHWIKNEDILNLNMWEGDFHFIPLLFESKEFNIKLYYKENKLINHLVK